MENASAGMALEGWSCERLAQEFPDAKMRREYDWVKNPQAGGDGRDSRPGYVLKFSHTKGLGGSLTS